MELIDFFHQLQYEIKSSISDSLETDSEYPFPEFIFTDHMIQHMIAAGMTFDQAARCYYSGKSGNAHLKISGYALSEEADQLDLFIALYSLRPLRIPRQRQLRNNVSAFFPEV